MTFLAIRMWVETKQTRFHDRLNVEGRRRRDRRIRRVALQYSNMSSWVTLFGSWSDQAPITLTGLDHTSFRYFLNIFRSLYDNLTPHSKSSAIVKKSTASSGRKRIMASCYCMGLVLSWYRKRRFMSVLCMIFGIKNSVCAIFIIFPAGSSWRCCRRTKIARKDSHRGRYCAFYSEHPRQTLYFDWPVRSLWRFKAYAGTVRWYSYFPQT